MKTHILIILAWGIGFSMSSYAESSLEFHKPKQLSGTTAASVATLCIDNSVCKQNEIYTRGRMSGRCMVVPGNGNPFSAPCNNVQLILMNKDKKVLSQTRTDHDGGFAFAPEEIGKASTYFIASGSKFYEIVSPQGLVNSNTALSIQVIQK